MPGKPSALVGLIDDLTAPRILARTVPMRDRGDDFVLSG